MSTLTMAEKKKVASQLKIRYHMASKKIKGVILAEFIEVSGYNHAYAARILRAAPSCNAPKKSRAAKARPRKYDETIQTVLLFLWKLLDYLCGKRIAPMLPILIDHLELHGELSITPVVRNKLLTISAATIDRLLKPVRLKMQLKGRCHTKPGTLLKHQIPIRTFAEWNEVQPGFLEIDLVGHDGGNAKGDFLFTLDATDVATGWTETAAVRNKAQAHVLVGLQQIRERLPFPLLGIDSDNGSEFINAHFLRYCNDERLTFTRGRAGRKNDGCFVEQKNYSIIRNAVGYARYDDPYQQDLLNKLYAVMRFRTNFFQPTMKLLSKTRVGSRVHKTYDTPTTPFQRVLSSPSVDVIYKETLCQVYTNLNLVDLAQNIVALQAKLGRSLV